LTADLCEDKRLGLRWHVAVVETNIGNDDDVAAVVVVAVAVVVVVVGNGKTVEPFVEVT
jgi:hypothetical protein